MIEFDDEAPSLYTPDQDMPELESNSVSFELADFVEDEARPGDEDKPGLLRAAYRASDNIIDVAVHSFEQSTQFVGVEDYDALDEPHTGYEDIYDVLADSASPGETEFIKAHYDRQQEAYQVINESGLLAGGAAMLATAVVDPISYIPFVGGAKKIKDAATAGKAMSALKIAGMNAAVVGGAEAARESFIAQTDYDPGRSTTEQAINILAPSAFAAALGGGTTKFINFKYGPASERFIKDQEAQYVSGMKESQKVSDIVGPPTPQTVLAAQNKAAAGVSKTDNIAAQMNQGLDEADTLSTRMNEGLEQAQAKAMPAQAMPAQGTVDDIVADTAADTADVREPDFPVDSKVFNSDDPGGNRLMGQGFIENTFLKPVGPYARVFRQKFELSSNKAREMMELLSDPVLLLEKHVRGVASNQSLDSIIRTRNNQASVSVNGLIKQEYKNYKTRIKGMEDKASEDFGRKGKPLTAQEFRERITMYDKAVQQEKLDYLAKYKNLDGFVSEFDELFSREVRTASHMMDKRYEALHAEMVDVGLFKNLDEARKARLKVARSFNLDKMYKEPSRFFKEFSELLKDFPNKKDGANVDLTEAERKEIARQVHQNITDGAENGEYDVMFRGTKLDGTDTDFPPVLLREWMEPDAERSFSQYIRAMAPRIEMQRAFGGTNFTEYYDMIRKEGIDIIGKIEADLDAGKINQATASKKINQSKAAVVSQIEGINQVRNRMLGLGAIDSSFIKRGGKIHRTLNAVGTIARSSKLGGMWVTSIPDIARPVLIDGITPYMGLLSSFASQAATEFKKMRLTKAEYSELAGGIEWVNQNRLEKYIGQETYMVNRTGVEKGIDSVGNLFNLATMMTPWNSTGKDISVALQFSTIVKYGQKLSSGKKIFQKKQLLARLSRMGLSEDDVKAIAKQWEDSGADSHGTFRAPNFNQWEDQALALKAKTTLSKVASDTVITPEGGDLPALFDDPLLKIPMMFKSFAYSAWNRIAVQGAQHMAIGDVRYMSMMVSMLGMSAAAIELKAIIQDKKTPDFDTPDYWLDVADKSGIAPLFWELNNSLDHLPGRFSLNNALGADPNKKMMPQSIATVLGGVAGGMADDVFKGAGAAVTGDWDKSKKYFGKTFPGQNLFYWTALKNNTDITEDF